MDINTLRQHVLTLATLEETDAPVVSCYLNLETGMAPAFEVVHERLRLLRTTVPPRQRDLLEQALLQLESRLAAAFRPETLGAALFSRGGAPGFFLELEFRVPLPTWIAAGSTPNIYHLVELKDTYDRYVVVLANEYSTRILEIHLGEVTKAVWTRRPELRERVGRGWSREHYQSRRRERNQQYASEIARFLDSVMSKGGYGHLILAGTPRTTAQLRQALPKRLASKLIDVVGASTNDRTSDVVAATLASFIDREQQESLAAVERLRKEIWSHGLAVVGAEASLEAPRHKQGDLLVMATEFLSEPAWICAGCQTVQVRQPRPAVCPSCGWPTIRELDLREELVRQAELARCEVEIVRDSESLMSLGGVGCLLRSASPGAYVRAATPA